MDGLKAAVKEQGAVVAQLKAKKTPKDDVAREVAKLKALKQEMEAATRQVREEQERAKKEAEELRRDLTTLMTQRFIVVPSFEIYGGVGGLYDFGPPGCGIRDNIIALWKRHFILQESMLEISCSAMTPDVVLRASGHVERFTDLMVTDQVTEDSYRADKLLEEHIDGLLEKDDLTAEERTRLTIVRSEADGMNAAEMDAAIASFGILAPETKNPLSEAFPFNLMFGTQIGPSGRFQGFLRPETAQGMFVNFKRLLEFNGSALPFAAAQIGLAFRNEIAPRHKLIRVREFTLAEIEHFVHPNDKSHPKFARLADTKMPLVSAPAQMRGDEAIVWMPIGEAVSQGMVDNETLGYFMARTMQFLLAIGIHENKVRFKQHKPSEMAHYATDCWDAEIMTSYGWVECVGHADRSAYDLTCHARDSKIDLSAYVRFDEPREVDVVKKKVNKGKLGPKFRQDAKAVAQLLEEMSDVEALEMEEKLERDQSAVLSSCDGRDFLIDRNMVSMSRVKEVQNGERFIPGVIEPSFGIGRIVFALLEHAFWKREPNEEEKKKGKAAQRRVLSLRPRVAPTKVSVLPLSGNASLVPFTMQVSDALLDRGISINADASSVSIGKRYSRADELGIPFGITIDPETVEDKAVTVRERDSLQQIRIPITETAAVVEDLVLERRSWADVRAAFPHFE